MVKSISDDTPVTKELKKCEETQAAPPHLGKASYSEFADSSYAWTDSVCGIDCVCALALHRSCSRTCAAHRFEQLQLTNSHRLSRQSRSLNLDSYSSYGIRLRPCANRQQRRDNLGKELRVREHARRVAAVGGAVGRRRRRRRRLRVAAALELEHRTEHRRKSQERLRELHRCNKHAKSTR